MADAQDLKFQKAGRHKESRRDIQSYKTRINIE